MSIAESLHHGVGAKSQKTETYFDAWSRTLFSEATLQKFVLFASYSQAYFYLTLLCVFSV